MANADMSDFRNIPDAVLEMVETLMGRRRRYIEAAYAPYIDDLAALRQARHRATKETEELVKRSADLLARYFVVHHSHC